METAEVSMHQARVFRYLQRTPGWLSNHDIAHALAMPGRTVRAHTRKLVALGLCDQVEVFPGHHYRLADQAQKRNPGMWQRLEQAAEVFQLDEVTHG